MENILPELTPGEYYRLERLVNSIHPGETAHIPGSVLLELFKEHKLALHSLLDLRWDFEDLQRHAENLDDDLKAAQREGQELATALESSREEAAKLFAQATAAGLQIQMLQQELTEMQCRFNALEKAICQSSRLATLAVSSLHEYEC